MTIFEPNPFPYKHPNISQPASEFYMPTFRNTLFHLHKQVGVKNDYFRAKTFSRINTPTFLNLVHSSHLPAYENGKECSETSAYKIQTPGNYPEESIQYSEQVESLKSRIIQLNGNFILISENHSTRSVTSLFLSYYFLIANSQYLTVLHHSLFSVPASHGTKCDPIRKSK